MSPPASGRISATRSERAVATASRTRKSIRARAPGAGDLHGLVRDLGQRLFDPLLHAKTGAEMEALTGCSVAALTVYDMCKSLTKGIVVQQTRLIEKTGGKSGDWKSTE